MNFARRVFFISAVYGVIVIVPQYFLEAKVGRDFPPPITHPEFYYGFVGVALGWQFLYFVVAKNPVRYRGAIWPGIFEKVAFTAAVVPLYLQGKVALPILIAGLIDFAWGVLFFFALRSLPAED